MKSRYIVLGFSLVLALALAVPALGGPTNPIASISASVKQTANKALKKAKSAQAAADAAQATANSAQSTANSAQSTAKTAQSTATTALNNAKTAQTTANEAKTAATNAQTTANKKFGQTFSEFGTFEGPNTTFGFGVVACPGGSSVTGGGYEVSGEGTNQVVASFTATYGNAWLAALERIPGGTKTWSVRPVVVCAKP